MRQRLLNLSLVLAFLGCYLEWGGGNSAFVAEVEYLVLVGRPEARTFLHPLIAIPFLGQLLILFTLFQKTPSRRVTSAGVLLMGVLVLLLAVIAGLSRNVRIGLSILPFFVLTVIHFARRKTAR